MLPPVLLDGLYRALALRGNAPGEAREHRDLP
jgi:hypothetical protein